MVGNCITVNFANILHHIYIIQISLRMFHTILPNTIVYNKYQIITLFQIIVIGTKLKPRTLAIEELEHIGERT